MYRVSVYGKVSIRKRIFGEQTNKWTDNEELTECECGVAVDDNDDNDDEDDDDDGCNEEDDDDNNGINYGEYNNNSGR